MANRAAVLAGESLTGLVWPPHAARLAGRLAGGLSLAVSNKRNPPATRAEAA